MVARRSAALRPPDTSAHDFARFPRKTRREAGIWYRQHLDRPTETDRGAWYFGSHPPGVIGPGRFDLTAPAGTCYLASTQRAAVFECIGPEHADRGWVDAGLLKGRVLSALSLPREVRAADATATRAGDFRVTNELHSGNDYATTQAWAQVFHDVGFGGVNYPLRFSPGPARGLALFGTAGVPSPRPAGDPNPMGLRHIVEGLGIQVIEPPSLASLRVVSPVRP